MSKEEEKVQVDLNIQIDSYVSVYLNPEDAKRLKKAIEASKGRPFDLLQDDFGIDMNDLMNSVDLEISDADFVRIFDDEDDLEVEDTSDEDEDTE